ncbi:hypothetical protein AXF42_Ash018899 [Apostasia shenzhenica]|uniref:Uncharacterized protein n=1 Tax=Apostasia shenzhenica TaxID=1088818 RepID=A0A2I0B531_9ASPA|nr:hypothetical protein AXF42_Ash018899 [Apostasia shenzhenica]
MSSYLDSLSHEYSCFSKQSWPLIPGHKSCYLLRSKEGNWQEQIIGSNFDNVLGERRIIGVSTRLNLRGEKGSLE